MNMPQPNNEHIVIVEDEEKIAQLLMDYLQQAGYRCTWLADGVQAEQAVREQHPDLILLDLMLPGRDGLDLCRALRQF